MVPGTVPAPGHKESSKIQFVPVRSRGQTGGGKQGRDSGGCQELYGRDLVETAVKKHKRTVRQTQGESFIISNRGFKHTSVIQFKHLMKAFLKFSRQLF